MNFCLLKFCLIATIKYLRKTYVTYMFRNFRHIFEIRPRCIYRLNSITNVEVNFMSQAYLFSVGICYQKRYNLPSCGCNAWHFFR